MFCFNFDKEWVGPNFGRLFSQARLVTLIGANNGHRDALSS
jgi:hypothetical protein